MAASTSADAQPTLIDMDVQTVEAVDPEAPVIEMLEVKATRTEASTRTNYSILLQGTLARPDGLDNAYGPMAWAAVEALDAEGNAMRFTTEGYVKPDGLQNEPVAELYKRIGPTMSRVSADRLPFAVRLRELDYLTSKFKQLALRSYAIVAEDEQSVELDLPALGSSADVAGAWVLTVEQLSDRQEVLLHAVENEPSVWPLRLELIDAEGNIISKGFRRGTETRDHTVATQWRFSQPTLVSPPAPEVAPEIQAKDDPEGVVGTSVDAVAEEGSVEKSAAEAMADGVVDDAIVSGAESTTPDTSDQPVPLDMGRADWRLRIHHAAGLHVRQLDAVLGGVRLIDLSAPAESP